MREAMPEVPSGFKILFLLSVLLNCFLHAPFAPPNNQFFKDKDVELFPGAQPWSGSLPR
jgi:hypothetical protein